MAGDKDHRQIRHGLPQFLSQGGALQFARHDNIRHQKVDFRVGVKQRFGLIGGLCGGHAVACGFKDFLHHLAHFWLIFDQQDTAGGGLGARGCVVGGFRRVGGFLGGGEVELKRGAVAQCGIHQNRAAGLLHEAQHHGQAEAGAAPG